MKQNRHGESVKSPCISEPDTFPSSTTNEWNESDEKTTCNPTPKEKQTGEPKCQPRIVRENRHQALTKSGATTSNRTEHGKEEELDFLLSATNTAMNACCLTRHAAIGAAKSGKPWQDSWKPQNASLGRELLDREIFENMQHLQTRLEQWRREYNEERPHGSCGNIPPCLYAGQLQPSTLTITKPNF